MTRHILQGRSEDELSWFRRRSFLQAAAAWTALGGYGAAQAQQRTNIVDLQGEAALNGLPLRRTDFIQTGDRIETAPDSHLVFVIGNSAFQVRPRSNIAVERGATLNIVSVLRLITGAVVSVWGRGSERQVFTPTLTAGIRGTGVYTEVFPERTYFCNCYGTVELASGGDHVLSQSVYHQSFWTDAQPDARGRMFSPAQAINHTDEELEYLAGLVDQRTAWQIAGRKGEHNGNGYMDPAEPHPLMR